MEKNEHTCQRTHVQNYGYAIKVDVRTTLYCDCFFRQKMLQKFFAPGSCMLLSQLSMFEYFWSEQKKEPSFDLFIYIFIYLYLKTAFTNL